MAAADADAFSDVDPAVAAVLVPDGSGNPRSIRLLASLVEAEARRSAAAASRPAESDLVKAFRGGAAPKVAIGDFLERAQRCFRFDGSCYVLAAVYLTRFVRSRAARNAGLLVEPATAHRLVAVALILGAKFASPRYYEKRAQAIEICSDRSIRASEMGGALELPFLLAIDHRLFVSDEEFRRCCRFLERGPAAAGRSCGDRKRKAAAEGGEEERRVRACRPPVVAS